MYDLVVNGTRGGTAFLDALRDRAVPWQVTIDLGRLDLLSGTAAVVARGNRRWPGRRRHPDYPGTLLQGAVVLA